MIKYINLTEKEDFLFRFRIKESFTETTDSTTLPSRTYAWNNAYHSLRVNDSDTIFGGFEIPLGFLNIGDIVEIECEFWNISGVKAKIIIDYKTDDTFATTNGSSSLYQSVSGNTDGFKKSKVTYTAEKDSWAQAALGTFSSDIGDYYIRNVRIKVTSFAGQNTPQQDVQRTKYYNIHGTAEGFEVSPNYGYDTAKLVVDSVNRYITLTHDKPFTGEKKGVSYANITALQSDKYAVSTRSEQKHSLLIYIRDIATNTFIDPATLQNNPNIYINVNHIGYDKI